MYRALLIGFKYDKSLKLPGVHVDLYNCYRYCVLSGAKISVCTDIESDERVENLTSAVYNDVVDSGVISFISKIKERNEYNYVSDKNSLNKIVEEIFNEIPGRLFIYFTGHGVVDKENNGLILPDNNIYSFYKLRNLIMSLTNKSEIIWINDCCHVSGMGLPYKLNNEEMYELTDAVNTENPAFLINNTEINFIFI